MELEEWVALFESQGGACAICGRLDQPLCVDHDHDTMRIRGLLCFPCNRGIGLLQDSATVISRAAVYVGGVEVLVEGQ